VLFAGAARSRRPLDGGAWIEAARANSLSDRGALTIGAGSGQSQVDDDDAQLAAYNAYLATLSREPGATSSAPDATKSHDAR
jgi:hypothetical protein